jgi:hypothetical protein
MSRNRFRRAGTTTLFLPVLQPPVVSVDCSKIRALEVGFPAIIPQIIKFGKDDKLNLYYKLLYLYMIGEVTWDPKGRRSWALRSY